MAVRKKRTLKTKISSKEKKFGKLFLTKQIYDKSIKDSEFKSIIDKSIKNHTSGRWGDIHPGVAAENSNSLHDGYGKIISHYNYSETKTGKQITIYIITEADRSKTIVTLDPYVTSQEEG